MFLERACKKYRKEEKVHRNLMADQTRFPARGVHKKHKKSGQLHPNLVCGQARFSLTEMIEICQATSLSSLEYRGMNLHDLCFKNSANPVKLFFDILGAEAADIYHLSKTLTQVKTLSLCLRNRKGFEVPNLVPIFAKLEKLVLLMADVDPKLMLEFILSLLKASPLLHRLELHLPSLSKKNRGKLQMKSTLERLFQHKCLKKVKIFNFQGAPVELQLVRYLLKSATGVDSMTIVRREQLYEGDGKWRGSQFEPGVTRKQVLTRLVGHLPFFTRLTVL